MTPPRSRALRTFQRLGLCLPILVAGCYHATGGVVTRSSETRVPSSKRVVSVPLPEHDTFETHVGVGGDDTLSVRIERHRACRQDEVTTLSGHRTTSDDMPGHWVVFGAGAAAVVGGVVTWAMGESMISDNATGRGRIPDAERENSADTGRTMVPVGLGVLALGSAVLTSEAIDLWLGRETTTTLPSIEETTAGNPQSCGSEPAEVPVVLTQGDLELPLPTPEKGLVRVNLLQAPWNQLRFQRPFAEIRCKSCEPAAFDLPAASGARLAVAHRSRPELEAWLAAFPAEPAANEVRATLEAVLADDAAETARQRAAAAQAAAARLANARRALKEQRFTDGHTEIAACMAHVPGDAACLSVQAELRRAEAASDLLRARKAIDRRDWYAVADASQHCLSIEPENARCRATYADAVRVIHRTQADHVKDFTAYEEGDGYMTYFSLVDASGRPVPARGKVELSFSFESGHEVSEVPIDAFDVSPADFEVRELGRGFFARGTLIASKYVPSAQFFSRVRDGRRGVREFARGRGEVFVRLTFTDPLGRKLEARDRLFVQ